MTMRYIMGGERGGNAIPHQLEAECSANHTVKLQPSCTHDGQTTDHC